MLHSGKSIVIIHDSKKGNNYKTAQIISTYFNAPSYAVGDNPDISGYEIIIFVIPNVGDEELPQSMENFLCNLKIINKRYVVCELGNYFGFEKYGGCKQFAIKILNALGWKKISDISIDSLPELDLASLNNWLKNLVEFLC